MANTDNYFEQAGSGTDNKLVIGGSFETSGEQSLKKVYLTVDMTDISTASTVYLPSPFAGTITGIRTIINGAIATADAVITGKIAAVAITGGAVTIAYSGSAAGDVDTVTPSAANTVVVGSNINFTTNGASTNTIRATIVVEITLS
jgi:hypothetical protein